MSTGSLLTFLICAVPLAPHSLAQPTPLSYAHVDNDHDQTRPLHDALAHGFVSLETDVYLINGQIFINPLAEDAATLEAAYLDPLRLRSSQNGGMVFRDGPSLQLLLDIKTEAEPTYTALNQILRRYADVLTIFTPDGLAEGSVTVILTGNRPRVALERELVRYAAYDGRLDDLSDDASPAFMPLISDDWSRVCAWDGTGPLPPQESERLRRLVERVHESGRKLRFWGLPDTANAWDVLMAHGVDFIQTNDLGGLRDFMLTSASAD